MVKYNVFDPVSGLNNEVSTIEEALKLQDSVKETFLQHYQFPLVINKIVVNDDNSETWSVLPQTHKIVSTFD